MKNITSIVILITVSITSSCCNAQAKDGPGFDCTKASNVFVIDLGDMPLDIGRWAFQKEGLRIQFNPYEVAAYAFGTPKVLIPWDVLRQYVVVDPPIAKELFEPGIK
jgi:hypothetical protein